MNTTLLGRSLGEFIIRQKLGEGGFGGVYKAYQPLLAREAVVKVLHQKHHQDPEVIERFIREARIASQLEHPYNAHIYAFGAEADGLLWIAMELVRGTPLDQILKQGPLRLDTFTPLLERICEVVHTAHEANIVHRDLKPANVMVLSRAGRLLPKLLDFGIAKAISAPTLERVPQPLPESLNPQQTLKLSSHETVAFELKDEFQTLGLVGSPLYMSPEQWRSSNVDSRADIYALGILSYEVLTGKPPFKGDLLTLIQAHDKEPLPSLGSNFPPELDEVLRRATAKAPQDRYQTALEFAEAFRIASRVRPDPLPQMDIELRQRLLAAAPQPIAEAVAALGSAENLHQTIDSIKEILHATARYIGVLALALHAAHPVNVDEAQEAFRKLRRRRLDDQSWVALAKLVNTLPELGELFEKGLQQRLTELLQAQINSRSEVTQTLRKLEILLTSLLPLFDYLLVVPHQGLAKSWMGALKERQTIPVAEDLPPRPILIGPDHQPIVELWPLVQVAVPMAGHPEELFLFDGKGRSAARFVSIPAGFEVEDEDFWDWYTSKFLDIPEESIVPVQIERPPYPGLSAFTASNSDLFFGRERDVERCLNRLKVESLLTIVGSSGAGKSSFVQAGLLPNLDAPKLVVRPGATPLSNLQSKLDPQTLVIVVDQFEELFTLCNDIPHRNEYARFLCALVDQGKKVILTLRDDFLLRARELPALGERLQQSLELLSTPQLPDLVRTLTLPAARSGYEFDDPELPYEIAREVSSKAAALPLLAFTALKLWEKRDKRRMRRADYLAMGGVAGALASYAEETLSSMSPEEIELVRLTFQKLVTAEGTRAVIKRAELVELLGPQSDRVLERLISARLLSFSEGEVEIVHEALLEAWPRLVRWRQNNEERFRLELSQAARNWDERGRPDALLWRDELLAELRLWRGRYKGTLSSLEEAFAKASIAEAHRNRRNRRIAVLLAGLILVSGLIILFIQRKEAELHVLNLYTEQGRQELQAGRPDQALVYLSQAYTAGKRDAGIRFMLAQALEKYYPVSLPLLEGHRAEVLDVAFSPDSKFLATASADHTAKIWDSSTGSLLRSLPMNAEVHRLAFSPDSKLLATASEDGTLAIWELQTGEQLKLLKSGKLTALCFSPDSRLLAGSGEHTLKLWRSDWSEFNLYTSSSLLTFADFSPDSKLILVAEADLVRILEVSNGREVAALSGHEGTIQTARFSPDGRRIVTAASDSSVRLWQTTGQQQIILKGHSSIVNSAAFSPDGQLVASCATDRSVRFWDSSTGRPLVTLTPSQRIVNALSYDPTGSVLAMASDDQTVRLLSVRLEERSPAEVARLVKEKVGLALVGERIETTTSGTASKPLTRYRQPETRYYDYETVTIDSRGRKLESKRLKCEGYVEDLGGVPLEMVKVPAGSLLMGSPEDEFKREKEYESPQHQVSLKSFYIGRFEVTQAQWEAVMGTNPSTFKGKDLPVDSVDWNEANAFCRKLSQMTGRRYRLPTEAEWEYACRATTTTAFHFGETITTDLANYDGNSSYKREPRGRLLSKTTPVGSYGVANKFGLFDMHGNLHEWCQDVLHNGYEGAPTDGSAWERPYGDTIQRVLRGGSWSSDPDFCRSAVRVRAAPTLKSYVIGLRVVRGE